MHPPPRAFVHAFRAESGKQSSPFPIDVSTHGTGQRTQEHGIEMTLRMLVGVVVVMKTMVFLCFSPTGVQQNIQYMKRASSKTQSIDFRTQTMFRQRSLQQPDTGFQPSFKQFHQMSTGRLRILFLKIHGVAVNAGASTRQC